MSPTAMFKRGCKDFDPGPCASFIPGGPYGAPEIELGPYGASLDFNIGKDFAYPIADGDADDDATCSALSNGQTSQVQQSVDYTLYSVYRPGQFNEGEKVPLIVWGDGTCAWPEAYGPLLRYVASYGFVIVAPNSRWVGDGSQMKKALDFMFAANDDKNSPYYQKLDTTKVGAMGHSQGGSGTIAVASDARVKAVIIWNGGSSASKPFLAVTGDGDILDASPASMRQDIDAATVSQAAFLYYHMILQMSDVPGHLTLVTEPQRVVEPALAWWQYILNGDAEAKAFFVGTDCKLCNRDGGVRVRTERATVTGARGAVDRPSRLRNPRRSYQNQFTQCASSSTDKTSRSPVTLLTVARDSAYRSVVEPSAARRATQGLWRQYPVVKRRRQNPASARCRCRSCRASWLPWSAQEFRGADIFVQRSSKE